MASGAYSRTDQYVFVTQKSNYLCLVCSETTPSIPSVYRLVRDMKCQTSQCTVSHRMLPLINLAYFSLLPHRHWMPIILLVLLHCTWHVSITHVCTKKPTFVLSFIYVCAFIWPPAPLKRCYQARHLKEMHVDIDIADELTLISHNKNQIQ